ncbi:MAG: hypothetical protein Homavirus20_4 [Homavirus sp.]|uniref:Metallo-beta-lactamase domain-containing protein n=1 Tax=Homavirus sp. TaxID=2487769 RepID=A0A3G5A4U3_9VIRU|nr:MAG: hypothetical protein Homavirus20_4 [Homavirus sp.]
MDFTDKFDHAQSPHFLEDCPKWKMLNTNLTLQGHSIAGERTGFMIPELCMFLDGGMNSYRKINSMLLTHGHSDHSHNISCVATDMGEDISNNTFKRPTVYAPIEIEEPIKISARAGKSLNDGTILDPEDKSDIITVVPVVVGQTFRLFGRNENTILNIDILKCIHTVPTLGYLISSISKKLRKDLIGASKEDIKQRRLNGEQITEEHIIPLFAFMGDTNEQVFEHNPILFQGVPIIIIECTGVDKKTQPPDVISSRKHCHWEHLKPIVTLHPEITFVLIHFSRCLKESTIYSIIRESNLPNVVLWFDSGPVHMAQIINNK